MSADEHIDRAEAWANRAEEAAVEYDRTDVDRGAIAVSLTDATHAAGMARMHVALASVLMAQVERHEQLALDVNPDDQPF